MYDPPKKYVFQATTPTIDQAEVMVDYIMKDLKAENPKMAAIYQDDAWGKDGLRGFSNAAKRYGLMLVDEEPYKRGSIDFTSQVANMKRNGADFILVSGVPPFTSGILNKIKEMDWHPTIIADAGSNTPKFIDLAGDAAKSAFVAAYITGVDEDVPGMVDLKRIDFSRLC